MKLKTLGCPDCGGSIAPPLGDRCVRCRYCGGLFYCSLPGILKRFRLPATHGEEEIRRRMQQLFRKRMLPRDLSRSFTIRSVRRVLIPFYLMTGLKGGTVLFQEVDAEHDIVISRDTRASIGPFRHVYFATTLEGWDLHDTDLRDVITDHMDAIEAVTMAELSREGEILDTDIPVERIVERGVATWSHAMKDIDILELDVALLYLPVAQVTFTYRGMTYSVTIDLVGGRWISGTLPFRRSWAVTAAIPLSAVAGWSLALVGRAWGSAIPQREFAAPLAFLFFAALIVALVLLLQAGLVFLMTPYQVRLKPHGLTVVQTAPSPRHPLPWLAKPVGLLVEALGEAFSAGETRS